MRSYVEGTGGPEDGDADRLTSAAFGGALCLTLLLASCTSRPPSPSSLAPSQSPGAPGTAADALQAAPAIAERAVSDTNKDDPGSPEALTERLEFAGQLIASDAGDCQTRLKDAQAQLDAFSADPSGIVVLPLGAARLADLQYRLHTALAACPPDSPRRGAELHAALSAAQQAVGLYRDGLDYESMAVMQFNVGVTQHLLGESAAALASLKQTLDMDREFAFEEDAAKDARLLAPWSRDAGATASDSTVVVSAAAAPKRVTFKLWQPADAHLTVVVDESAVIDGNSIHARAHRSLAQQARKEWDSWVISYDPGAVDFDSAQWPHEIADVRNLAASVQQALALPGYRGNSGGELVGVRDLQAFATQQLQAARALALEHLDSEQREDGAKKDLRALRIPFDPRTIQVHAAEDYNFQVSMWSGATLEQGVWYDLVAPLPLPGIGQMVAAQDLEFAYTRDVPCARTPAGHSATPVAAPACIELVVHAKPQNESIQYIEEQFKLPWQSELKGPVHYWAATYVRLVTDPATLATQEYDIRRYWHFSDSKAVTGRVENASERIVTTFAY